MKKFLIGALLMGSLSSFAGDKEDCAARDPSVDRAACLKEMRNARAEDKTGGLTTDSKDLRYNRVKRCYAFQEPERQVCVERTLRGTSEGSASSGGTITTHKEVVIVK